MSYHNEHTHFCREMCNFVNTRFLRPYGVITEITIKSPQKLYNGSSFSPHFTQKSFFLPIEKFLTSSPQNKIPFMEALFKLIFVHSHVALFRLERSASSSVARIWQLAQRKESCLQDWSACRRWFSLEVEMRKLLPRMARQRRIWRMGRGGASLSSNSMPASSLSLALWTTSVRGMILR